MSHSERSEEGAAPPPPESADQAVPDNRESPEAPADSLQDARPDLAQLTCPRCGAIGLEHVGDTRYSVVLRCDACAYISVERRQAY